MYRWHTDTDTAQPASKQPVREINIGRERRRQRKQNLTTAVLTGRSKSLELAQPLGKL